MSGMIHVYTGDGKGKTTAALGLIARAAGYGQRTVLVQFLKGRATGELSSLRKLENVTVLRLTRDFGFFGSASDADKAEIIRQNKDNLREASRLAGAGMCDLLVLDEFLTAYARGALDTALADSLVSGKPPELELVLTGRSAPPHLINAADYCTEFVKRRHPYDRGVPAREGVEF